jgi:hypothetical protein
MLSVSALFGPCLSNRSLSSIVIWSLSTTYQSKSCSCTYTLCCSIIEEITHTHIQQHNNPPKQLNHLVTYIHIFENTNSIPKINKMSELLENFSIEDLMTPTAEQGSSTVSLSDLDMSLDPNMSDFPVDLSDIPTGGVTSLPPPLIFPSLLTLISASTPTLVSSTLTLASTALALLISSLSLP